MPEAGQARRQSSTAPYHLTLEIRPAAVFPYLAKFGKVEVDVYPSGVAGEALFLSGFSRNGTRSITVMNPVARIYSDVPLSEISSILKTIGSFGPEHDAVPAAGPRITGKVEGIAATRHRLVFGPTAWIDVWMTSAVPENPQLRRIVDEVVTAISPGTGQMLSKIRGTPVYVELNFRRFKKVALVRPRTLNADTGGEAEAMKLGSFYMRSPFDKLWQ